MTPTEDSPSGGASLADRDGAGSTVGSAKRDLALEVARARAEAALFGGAVPLDGFDAPTRIGRFSLLRRLGAGAMGVVYAGQDEMLGRRVAIKLISPDRAGSSSARERMLREAQALAKLSHPNVVPVFEAGMHEGCIFLAMEYVEGRTLRQYAVDDAPGWRATVAAYVQAGRGLAAAHDAGLVHRDFKPDNAMLGSDGRVRVLDFGLVSGGSATTSVEPPTLEDDASGARLTRTGAILGTPAYMAPEQHLHAPIDARADQFAFCVALHEAVYGRRPFEADGLTALAVAVIEGRVVVPLRREPRWLYRVLRRGLAARAEARWPDMHALVRELERGLGRRHRKWVVAGTLAAGLGALAAALAWPGDAPAPAPPPSDPPAAATPRHLPAARQVTRLTSDVQVGAATLARDGETLAYWATRTSEQWLTIVPTRGGSGVATEHHAGVIGLSAIGFNAAGESLTLERRDTRLGLVATSPSNGAQRWLHAWVVPGFDALDAEVAAALSLDGRSLAILHRDTRRVLVVDPNGHETTVAIGKHTPIQIAWSPDGERLAWIERDVEDRDPPRLVLAAADGSAVREAADYKGLFGRPCAALTFAGNDRLVYAIYGSDSGLDISKLWEQRLDDDRLGFAADPELVQDATPGLPCSLSASEDGRRLAFVRYDRRETIQVAAIASDATLETPRPLTIDTTNENMSGWSADGREVVFFSWREREPAFYARGLEREAARRAFGASSGNAMLLGRDGDRLLYGDPAADRRSARIVSVSADGSEEVVGTLTELPWFWAISCAGRRCTKVVQEGDDAVVYEVGFAGEAPRELARERLAMGDYPHWFLAPDGRSGALLVWDDALRIVSLTGAPMRRLAVPNRTSVDPALVQFATWTPDSSALYLTGMNIDGHMYAMIRMDLDGEYEVVHTEPNRWLNRPYLSPDGTHIAFGTWDFAGDVWTIER